MVKRNEEKNNISEPRKELNQTFELTAEKSGEYYICLLGVSSDPISLKEGKIVIK